MKITLCYIDYECKITLEAKKKFKKATGKDLWCTLLRAYSAFIDTAKDTELARQVELYESVSEQDALELFHLVTGANKDDLEDGMYRAGWRSYEDTTEQNQPWTYQLVNLAVQYDEMMRDERAKKPSASTKD